MILNKKKIFFLIIIIVGIITPFIPTITVIEMFFLLIPFGVIFMVTLIDLVICLINKKANIRKAMFMFLLLPTFILSQLLSGFTVDKTQYFRSEKLIETIERIKNETGEFPKEYELSLGINYKKLKDENGYILEYSRGFLVTEKYDSRIKKWESYGWND